MINICLFLANPVAAQPLGKDHDSVESLIAPALFVAIGTIKSVEEVDNVQYVIRTKFDEVIKKLNRAGEMDEFAIFRTTDRNAGKHKHLHEFAKNQTKGIWIIYPKHSSEKFRRWKFLPVEGKGINHFGYSIGSLQPPMFARDLSILESQKEILERVREYGPISQMVHDPNKSSVAMVHIPAAILGPIESGDFNRLSIPIDSTLHITARRLIEKPNEFIRKNARFDRYVYDSICNAGIDLLGSQKNDTNIKILKGCLDESIQPFKNSPAPYRIRTKAYQILLGWRVRIPNPEFAKKVTSLFLGSSGIDDDTLVQVSKLENLEHLNLWDTRISHVGIDHLRKLKKLKQIAVDDLVLTDSMVKTLSRNKQLYLLSQATAKNYRRPSSPDDVAHLKLWCAPITDSALGEFTKLKNLKIIDLGRMKITDAAIEHLASFKNLKHAELHETEITKDGAKRLRSALPNCDVNLR